MAISQAWWVNKDLENSYLAIRAELDGSTEGLRQFVQEGQLPHEQRDQLKDLLDLASKEFGIWPRRWRDLIQFVDENPQHSAGPFCAIIWSFLLCEREMRDRYPTGWPNDIPAGARTPLPVNVPAIWPELAQLGVDFQANESRQTVLLKDLNIAVDVVGRIKFFFSRFCKHVMSRNIHGVSADVFGVRLLVQNSPDECDKLAHYFHQTIGPRMRTASPNASPQWRRAWFFRRTDQRYGPCEIQVVPPGTHTPEDDRSYHHKRTIRVLQILLQP